MADIHVLTGDAGGNQWKLVFHFPVPNSNNDVGVNFQTALVNSNVGRREFDDGTFGRRTVLPSGAGPGHITTAEEANLDNGSLFEVVETFKFSKTSSQSDIEELADAKFAILQSRTNDRMGEVFRYFGHTRDVP